MKSYFNLFLILVMPLSVLFTAISFVYFSLDFTFSKALRLAILAGVLISVAFSIVMATVILVIRTIQFKKFHTQTLDTKYHNPAIFEHNLQITQTEDNENNEKQMETVEEKLMLLMDKELAYEVSLFSISHQKTCEVIYKNKKDGTILIHNEEKEIRMNITSLTKHTAQIIMQSTIDNVSIKNIISIIKEKEHSFIQY